MEVLREMRSTREDKALGAAVQGDFEAAVTAVQGSRTAELECASMYSTSSSRMQGCSTSMGCEQNTASCAPLQICTGAYHADIQHSGVEAQDI